MNLTKRSPYFLLITLLLVSGCQPVETPAPTPQPTASATPSPLTIDGTILPGEWDQAEVYSIHGGSTLFLLKEGDLLYLAVSRGRSGVLGANVFLNRGDVVQILHISAALGTAEFIREGESWSLTRNFDWKHRTVGNSEASLAERSTYFEEEGWSAPNALTGTPNHLEMQIRLEPETRLAISLLQSITTNPAVWPSGLEDDTGNTFSEGLLPDLKLEPEAWHLISD
jgi:hypothetical protein